MRSAPLLLSVTLAITRISFALPGSSADADSGVSGSERPRDFLRDACSGTDSVDLLVVGDSNSAIDGYGWVDGIVYGCLLRGAKYLGSPIYPMTAVANDLGFGVVHRGGDLALLDEDGPGDIPPFVSLPSCSPTGGCLERGDIAGPPSLTAYCDADDGHSDTPGPFGVVSPVGCRLDYGWLAAGLYTNFGAGLHVTSPGQFHERGGLAAEHSLTYRAIVGAGGGGSLTLRMFNPWTGASIAARRVTAPNDRHWMWLAADLSIAANAARRNMPLSCAWGGGMGGASDGVQGPIGLGWHSIFRPDVRGVSATPLAYRGGASLDDIRNDLERMSSGTIRQYFDMLRSRQQAAGGSGRVILVIQGGVNLDPVPLQSLATSWARNVCAIASRAQDIWLASGFPADQFGVLAMVSHPFSPEDPLLCDMRAVASDLAESGIVEGLAVVNIIKTAAWSSFVEGNWHLNTPLDSGPDDFYHLKPEGFAAVGARLVDALIERTHCVGDVDENGTVGGGDLTILFDDWGAQHSAADLDGDGLVDGRDITILFTNWGLCP